MTQMMKTKLKITKPQSKRPVSGAAAKAAKARGGLPRLGPNKGIGFKRSRFHVGPPKYKTMAEAKAAAAALKREDFGEMAWMPVEKLSIGRYQRQARSGMVREIVENFDPLRFQPLQVAKRKDGRYYVEEGHQRLLAARALGLKFVRCIVEHNTDEQSEARAFVSLNIARTGLTNPQIFKGRVIAGDKEALMIVAVLKQYGFAVVDPTGSTSDNSPHVNAISAVAWLMRAYRKNTDALQKTLRTVRAVWNGSIASLQATLLDGLWIFYCAYPNARESEVVANLRSNTPTELLVRARAKQDGLRGTVKGVTTAKALGQVVFDIYNRQRTQGRLNGSIVLARVKAV